MARQRHLRRLSIESTHYLWRIRRLDEQYVMLKVWTESRSRRDFPLEVRLRFDDPWLNLGTIITAPPERVQEVFQLTPITPVIVREIIEAAIRAGWAPLSPTRDQRFEWNQANGLIRLEE